MNIVTNFIQLFWKYNIYVSFQIIRIVFILFFSFGLISSSIGQSFFSPNPKVVINQQKSDAFIKATPEIALKAEYYNVSKAVLETILILQSNSGTSTSDDKYNYGRVNVHPELTVYPAFSKTKNGYILCSTRSRGVEATALSLSLMRNDGKNSLSEDQWLSLVFGQDGELKSLIQQADEIYTARTGNSFNQLDLNFANNQVAVDINKSELPVEDPIVGKQQSITKEKEDKTELPVTKVNDTKSSDSMPESVPSKNEDIKTNPATGKTELLNSKNSSENSNPKPADVAVAKEEIILPKDESKTIIEPETQSLKVAEDAKMPAEKRFVEVPTHSVTSESQVNTPMSANAIQTNNVNVQTSNNTNYHTTTESQRPGIKLYGPTDKGTQLLGGSASFVRADGNSILTINPNRGSFVADNFAIGINHLYVAKLDGDYSDYNALGPFIKFYVGNNEKGKVFAQVGGAIAVADLDFDYIQYSYGLRAGYAVFINKSIALEFSGGYEKVIDSDGFFGGNVGFQIHYNKNEKAKEDDNVILDYPPVPNLSGAELYSLGQTDAKKYYKGYKGAGTGTLITSLVSPLLGLIPAIACSSTRPKEINLDYPNPNFMQNSDYYKGYTDKAKKIKKKKVWTNWWIGFGVNVVAAVVLVTSK
jgi:hypothetical protein